MKYFTGSRQTDVVEDRLSEMEEGNEIECETKELFYFNAYVNKIK